MNNEPVAWMQVNYKDNSPAKFSKVQTWEDDIPLYTHPHPDNLGLAESIIKQQELKIKSMQERMIVAEQELNHMRSFFGCDPAYYGLTPAEPVAWIDPKELDMEVSTSVTKHKQFDGDIPLYTHPAKTLTEDEIGQVWKNMPPDNDSGLAFARAILRKASEKC